MGAGVTTATTQKWLVVICEDGTRYEAEAEIGESVTVLPDGRGQVIELIRLDSPAVEARLEERPA